MPIQRSPIYDKSIPIKCKYCGKNIRRDHMARHKKSIKCKIYQNHIRDIKDISPFDLI